MKSEHLLINGIPSILWGDKSDKLYIHVHGKMSCKEYAKAFAEIANTKGYQTLSFDLPEHGERTSSEYRCDIWNGMKDLSVIADYAFKSYEEVSLFACSLGAYFSLNTYRDLPFNNCLFHSPVLDMKYLIQQMFVWFSVSEEMLCEQKEIPTPIDTLRYDYYQYVLANPITKWDIPTAILFGGKDDLQSLELVEAFTDKFGCKLNVSPNSEHPFMELGDAEIVAKWLEDNI